MDTQPDFPGERPVEANEFPATPSSGNPLTLEEQYNSLRKLFIGALVVTLLLAGSFDVYVLSQLATVRKDLRQTTEAVATFQKTEGQSYNAFVNNLAAFARTHPDFAPIFAKYNVTTTDSTPRITPPK